MFHAFLGHHRNGEVFLGPRILILKHAWHVGYGYPMPSSVVDEVSTNPISESN
jgi:hypothetical protein